MIPQIIRTTIRSGFWKVFFRLISRKNFGAKQNEKTHSHELLFVVLTVVFSVSSHFCCFCASDKTAILNNVTFAAALTKTTQTNTELTMNFFKRPKRFSRIKTRFIPIFHQQSDFVKQAAMALLNLVESDDPSEWKKCEREIKQCEIKGDAMLSEFYQLSYDVLIHVMDREDLQTIASNIDEFLDSINSCAKSILLYNPEKIAPQIKETAVLIDREASSIQKIVGYMDDLNKNFSQISLQCDSITAMEHDADDIYEEYIGEIFREETNAVELMKYKNMAEVFEAATDRAKTFSDHIRKLQLRFI